jgi:fumarylacetoacetase
MAEPSQQQQLRSFVEVPAGSHFPIQNLPFGVFRRRGSQAQAPRPAVAIGDFALDLAAVADAGLFDGPVLSGSPCFHQVHACSAPQPFDSIRLLQ